MLKSLEGVGYQDLVRACSGGIIFVTCPAITCFVEHTSSHEIVVKTFIAVLLEHIMFFKSWLRTDLENQWKVSALKGFCLHLSVGHGGRKKSPRKYANTVIKHSVSISEVFRSIVSFPGPLNR